MGALEVRTRIISLINMVLKQYGLKKNITLYCLYLELLLLSIVKYYYITRSCNCLAVGAIELLRNANTNCSVNMHAKIKILQRHLDL